MPNPMIDADTLKIAVKGLMLMIVNLRIEVEAMKVVLAYPTFRAEALDPAREATRRGLQPLLTELGEDSDDKLRELLLRFDGGPIQ